ncbi:hypothetical protein A0H81_10673 [Grifola frondosa]|uniref:Uncharacterized protein n=1 Tax=Grifola frondosa TaxID=5627 RepID=A0A1C7LXI5_GRIFR|nr:hypothetical protein A0H81_10673 [Grifola frondosa]
MDPLLASRARKVQFILLRHAWKHHVRKVTVTCGGLGFFSKAEITPSAMVTREVTDRPKHRARAFCAPLALIDSLPFDIPDILLDSGIVRFPLGRNTVLYRNIYRSLLNLIAADGLVVLLQMPFLFPTHHRCASHHVNPHHGVRLFAVFLASCRIGWIGRQARATLGKRHAAKYNNAIAIIWKINAQGIVPTMIVARVGLVISAQDASTLPVHIRRDVEIDTSSYELDNHDGPTTSKIAFADPQDK